MLSFEGYPLFPEGALAPAPERCVSALIATYNRAPHPVDGARADENPLAFCLRSLAEQHCTPLREVIVIDDASSDHTAAVVERARADFVARGIAVHYLRNERRLDAHASRNRGAMHARGRLLYILDDDSVIPPHALAGAYGYYLRSEAAFPALAALALPVFQRATVPMHQRPCAEIATLDDERGELRGGFDCFPSEYAAGALALLEDDWLLPIPVDNLCGAHALIEREAMLAVGGFAVLPTRGYGGESGLALALARHGKQLRMVVDPRVHAVHLRYGNPRAAELTGADWRSYLDQPGPSLARMVEISAQAREDTGCRVSSEVWHYAKLRNTLALMTAHDPALGARYHEHSFRTFARSGRLGSVVEAVHGHAQRMRICDLAERDAVTLPEQTLAQLEARLRVPPISAVLLNYKRLENLEQIVSELKANPLVDDITIWNNADVMLRAEGALSGVSIIQTTRNTLFGRYAAALLARHECVFLQDDDLIVPEATLAALHAEYLRDPSRVHGIFGRDPWPDGSYARESNAIDADVDVVLTRCLLVHRRHIAALFAELAPFELEAASPPGNGEDIVLSYVAKRANGRQNRVYALPVRELPAPHAVHSWRAHRTHRTAVMRRCLGWVGDRPAAEQPQPAG